MIVTSSDTDPGVSLLLRANALRRPAASHAVSIMSEVSVRGRVESGQLVAIPIRSSHNLMRCIEIQVMAGRRLPDVAQKFIELLIAELERAV